MRLSSWVLSILLHVLVIGLGIIVPLGGKHIRIDLDKPIYEVKLVSLPKAKPAPARKAAPAKEKPKAKAVKKEAPKPEPKPQPKPEAKPVSAKKEPPKPKPTPKKVEAKPEPKPEPKPKPKPEKSREQILAEALGDVEKQTEAAPRREEQPEDTLAQALASIQEEVGSSQGVDSGRSAATIEEYKIAYGYQIGQEIQTNWRFPPIRQDRRLTAEVELRVGLDGSIYDVRMVTTSGREDFDASVLRAAEFTDRVTPPPAWLDVEKVKITFSSEDLK